jgi:predicted nucleotidyltransferase
MRDGTLGRQEPHMQPFMSYSLDNDSVIDALRAEAAAAPKVIGLLVTGSRGNGAVTAESDYDVIFVVSDETMARYERENAEPVRGSTLDPAIDASDIQWHECPRTLREYNTFGVDACRVVYDRTGELTALAEELSQMPQQQARERVAKGYDDYLNLAVRSLKCWRRGDELGAWLLAAQSTDALVQTLFALERRWPPLGSRLYLYLDALRGQGWQPGELRAILLDLLITANPHRQQAYARRVIALLAERSYDRPDDAWNTKVDQALARDF